MSKNPKDPAQARARFMEMTGLCNQKEDFSTFDPVPCFASATSDYSVRLDTPRGPILAMCHFSDPIEFDLLVPEGACCRLFLPRGRVNFFGTQSQAPQLLQVQEDRMVFQVNSGGWHMVCDPFRVN